MVVYITGQGGRIVRESQHLVVRQRDKPERALFPHQLEQLVVSGNVTLTQPALALLLEAGIDTVLLRADGRYLGRLVGPGPKNISLRSRQFILCEDADFALARSREFLQGKLANMAGLLKRISRARQNPEVKRAGGRIHGLANRLNTAESIGSLLGIEGAAASLYFQHYRFGLLHSFGFTRRIRRPPPDPVNTCLSLLYTFLANRAHAALQFAGLDPQPGYLHAPKYGRFGLPLDLMEEFRPLLVDALVLALFNRGVLKQADFSSRPDDETPEPVSTTGEFTNETFDPQDEFGLGGDSGDPATPPRPTGERTPPAYRIRLETDGFRKLIAAFEQKLETTFQNPDTDQTLSYGEALNLQARQLRRVIEGTEPRYRPLVLR